MTSITNDVVIDLPRPLEESTLQRRPAENQTQLQDLPPPTESTTSLDVQDEKKELDLDMENNAPHLSYWQLFLKFLLFGINAWGGPVQQIAMLKDTLVLEEGWISVKRFNKVYAVYQILPGPEAAELCCYFGMLSRGRIGSIIAGMGFILPGFFLMLGACFIYNLIGWENPYFNSSFRAMQPIVAAMVLRAVDKIASHALVYHRTGQFDSRMLWMAICSFLLAALHINFFITLAYFAIFWTMWDFWVAKKNKWWLTVSLVWIALAVGGLIAYVVVKGVPSKVNVAIGIVPAPPTILNLFWLGLVAGILSFGGAYTSLPFFQAECVLLGGWMTNQTFVDGVAIGNILPAPLVIVSTFIGFQGGLAGYNGNLGYATAGALVTTIGMFIPCFSFTIIGFPLWERFVHAPVIAAALEGITASVTGLIATIAMELLRYAVSIQLNGGHTPTVDSKLVAINSVGVSAVLYCLTLGVFYVLKPKGNVPLLLVVIGAIAGQFLYFPEQTS